MWIYIALSGFLLVYGILGVFFETLGLILMKLNHKDMSLFSTFFSNDVISQISSSSIMIAVGLYIGSFVREQKEKENK